MTREQVKAQGGVTCYEDKDAGGNSSLPASSFYSKLVAVGQTARHSGLVA
jgi:hypothetical protein